jgi:hypothetical protein
MLCSVRMGLVDTKLSCISDKQSSDDVRNKSVSTLFLKSGDVLLLLTLSSTVTISVPIWWKEDLSNTAILSSNSAVFSVLSYHILALSYMNTDLENICAVQNAKVPVFKELSTTP